MAALALAALAYALPATARARQPACAPIPFALPGDPPTALQPVAGGTDAATRRAPTVRYEITASLDPATRMLRGRERLQWRNPSRLTVCTLYLHLDLNAFEHSATRLMQARHARGTRNAVPAGEWGYSELTRIEQAGRSAVWMPVQPDGGAANDRSVVRVDLAEPVAPGATTTLDIAFASRLPGAWAGLGHRGDLHLAARWFPQIAVLEVPQERDATTLRWSAPAFAGQRHPRRDAAAFDVRLDLPEDYRLAASGTPVGAPIAQGDRRIHRFRLDDADDFAWVADSGFVAPLRYVYTPPGSTPSGRRPVLLQVFYRPGYVSAAVATMGTMADALARYHGSLAPYPHRTLTAVVVPGHTLGGRAYPGLFTASGYEHGAADARTAERLDLQTVDGVGAPYFAGLFADDDDATQTLEQALSGYWTARILRERGQTRQIPDRWLRRLGFAPALDSFSALRTRARLHDPLDSPSASATRLTLALHDLEMRIGEPAMDRVFRQFLSRQRAGAAAGRDQGDDISRLLAMAFATPPIVDDRIGSLSSEELLPQPGYVMHRGQRVELTPARLDQAIGKRRAAWKRSRKSDVANGPFPYRTVVVVERRGAMVPQLLEVKFADGTLRRVRWTGTQPTQRFEWITPSRAVSAQLDPQRHVLLDRNKLDDGRTLAVDTTPARRWAGDVAAVVQTLSAFLVGL